MDKMREEFEAWLNAGNGSGCDETAWKAWQAARQPQERGEVVAYLCDGMRFKVAATSSTRPVVGIAGLPAALAGRWVALVAADDDCHLAAASEPAAWKLRKDGRMWTTHIKRSMENYAGLGAEVTPLYAHPPAAAGSGEAVAWTGITLEQVARAREVALAATPGPWEWGSSPCPDSDTAKRICAENIDATKAPIGEFFEVFTPDGRRTSLVGNGPTSEANACYIAWFAPNNVLAMLDAIERAIAHPPAADARVAELEAEVKRLREEVHAHSGNEVDFAEQNAALESQLAESREREGRMRGLVEHAQRALAWNISNHDAKVSAELYEAFNRELAALAADKGEK